MDVEGHLRQHGARVLPLQPFGFEIEGLHLPALVRAGTLAHRHPFAAALELLMAHSGLIVFRGQGVMAAADQIAASELFGAGQLHSTHGEHALAGSEHIFRLSNSEADGIVGPGAEWHNDGSFMEEVFSHAGYHIVQLPRSQTAGTSFAHLGRAHDLLTDAEQRLMSRMISVNSNGGVIHPLVHTHPLSHRATLFLHLAMTGAIAHGSAEQGARWTALDDDELTALLSRVNGVLNDPIVAYHHTYSEGDLVMVDNWAVAHKAFPGSFDPSRGVRVVHRTTIKSPRTLVPPAEWRLPTMLPQQGRAPAWFKPSVAGRVPVWVEGYLGFRWRACDAVDLAGERSAGLVMMQTPCYAEGDSLPSWMRASRRRSSDGNATSWAAALL